jgi:hypothetical protein
MACPDMMPHTLAMIVIGAAVALLAVAILLRWFDGRGE